MIKNLKSLMVVAFTFVLLLGLTGCGEQKENNNDGTQGGNQQQGETTGVAWPSNEYTNLIPKPEGATIYDEKAVDNDYFGGHNITLTDWTIEECKAYAEKLKEAGFTTPGTGMKDVVVTDNGNMYSFGAKNSDGVYVTVGSFSGNNSGSISIQVTKE